MPKGSIEITERQRLFADRVRHYRHELGLSQEQLAHKAHVDRTYVASLETGRRNVSLDLIGVLAGALEVDAAELVRGAQAVPGRPRQRS
ncbi:MAG: helix-turn-helix domain-containing protein [Acidimicrobiales bacterium]